MAFTLQNFQSDGNQAGRGKAPQRFKYRTADTLATITANNYFTSIAGMLEVGDIIEVEFVDSVTAMTKHSGVNIIEIVVKANGLILALERNQGKRYLVATLTDVSAASTVAVTSNISGIIKNIKCVLGGAITVANSAMTFDIGGTAIGGSATTITQAASTTGTTFTTNVSGTMTAANGIGTGFIVPGSVITATSDGGSTTTQPLYIIYEVLTEVPKIHWETLRFPIGVTTATSEYIISPVAGTVVAIRAVISGDPGATVTVTGAIRDVGAATVTAITGGQVSLTNGGAAGNIYEAFPTAANAVAQNGVIRLTCSNNSANAIIANCQVAIIPS